MSKGLAITSITVWILFANVAWTLSQQFTFFLSLLNDLHSVDRTLFRVSSSYKIKIQPCFRPIFPATKEWFCIFFPASYFNTILNSSPNVYVNKTFYTLHLFYVDTFSCEFIFANRSEFWQFSFCYLRDYSKKYSSKKFPIT